MNFLKRAMLYVTRKKGKSIVLFCILLIMATFVLSGLSIGKATKQAQQNLRQSLGGSFHVWTDYTDNNPYLHKESDEDESGGTGYIMYSTEQLSSDMVKNIRDIAGVKYCDAFDETLLDFEQLSFFKGTIPLEEELGNSTTTVSLWRSEEHNLFTNGVVKLTEGRHITEKDTGKAIICKDLADKNGLGIGDMLKTRSMDGRSMTLEIVGLFTAMETEKIGKNIEGYNKIQNRVFIDIASAILIENTPAVQGFSEVSITINDPEEMDEIIEKVKKTPGFKEDGFTIDTDNETYENTASSLESMDKLVIGLLIAAILVSVVILSLILTLWGKSRVRETGVFLSLGIKKTDIIGQYLTEVLLIAIVAFGISFFTSNMVSNRIADVLLQQDIQNKKEEPNDVQQDDIVIESFESTALDSADNIELSGSENTDYLETDIEVSVSIENLLQLYLVGFVIIIVSVMISSIAVMRLKPREILSRMS